MSQVSIAVLVKLNNILAACRPEPESDGCAWRCARCGELVIRVSFGVMNGTLHCACGAEVELIVDGRTVDIEELNVLPGTPRPLTSADAIALQLARAREERWTLCDGQCGCHNCPNCECHKSTTAPAANDDEFLRGCGISLEEK